jgi:hypothetical protein
LSRDFLSNPSFAEYARLLFGLHGLIATEAGESAEADAIRERMDAAWGHLTALQRDELRQLSERLYAFHEDARQAG